MPEIEIGATYRRRYGNHEEVKVLAVSHDGFVKVRDSDGYHFIRLAVFDDYFDRVDDEKSLKSDDG
jgi:hypothetical protein